MATVNQMKGSPKGSTQPKESNGDKMERATQLGQDFDGIRRDEGPWRPVIGSAGHGRTVVVQGSTVRVFYHSRQAPGGHGRYGLRLATPVNPVLPESIRDPVPVSPNRYR